MTIRVSVVVPTYKRPELLNRCLTALIDQDFDPNSFEIIVVDDAPSEETQRLVEEWQERIGYNPTYEKGFPPLRYIPVVKNHGPAAARNVGWKAAIAPIIAFTDDDCLPDRRWLSAGIAAFQDGVIGVSGKIIVPLPDAPTDYEYNAAQLEKAAFATANCFYRREAIAQVNGFDERFTTAWREDSDLFFTFTKQGGKLISSEAAIVVHPVRAASWGVSLTQQQKSMFNALLYKKHPDLYRQYLSPVTPWHYYSIVIALTTAIAFLFTPWISGSLLAVCIWLFLTSRFCLKRLKHTSHSFSHITEMVITSILIPPLSLFWRIHGAIKFQVFFL